MKWIITERVHYDRVASCWLIKRFIDRDAQFLFAPRQTPLDELPGDAIPLAFPGAELGPHDEEGTLFTHILMRYDLDDPALDRLEEIVTGGVRYFSGVPPASPPSTTTRAVQIGIGLITLADGMQLMYSDDQERLEASYPGWDAMYALLRANTEQCPTSPILRTRECAAL